MAGKKIDTGLAKESFAKLNNLNELQKTEDGKLFPLMTDVGAWWSGKSADALESRAAQMFESVKAVREDTSLDLTQALTFVAALISKDRQYANKLAAFGSGNSIAKTVGTVGQCASKGMESMEFKNWLSKVTGVTADTSALKEYFSKSGHTLEEIYWIYRGLTRNGVTETHVANLQKIGYSFDDVVMDYSRITKITDKEIYSLMLQGGKYFEEMENKNPGSWKGMLTGITAGGELNQDTKLDLISYEKGIGAYYRNTYNKDGYGEKSPNKENAVTAIGKNERELVIRCYEEQHPEQAENLSEFFRKSGFNKTGTYSETIRYQKYQNDIENIKYISYSAPEPYRSLFLDNVSKERILCNSGDPDFQMNLIPLNGVIVDLDYAPNDRQGPYATFFHELGHGIDDLMYVGGNYSSHYTEDVSKYSGVNNYYQNTSSVTLKQVLEYDCSQAVLDSINKNAGNLSMEDKQIVQNLLMSNREDKDKYTDAYMLYLSKTDTEKKVIDQAVDTVKNELKSNLKYEENAAASDIYGGVSFNQLKSDWGHPENFYWRLYDGGMTSREATADYFSIQMTGDTKAMESMEKHLPNASVFLDSMFTSMDKTEE